MKADPYYLKARLFPTILTSIPLLVFIHKIITPLYSDSLKDISSVLPIIANLGLSAAVVYLSVQINRFVAKEVFQNFFFKDEIAMPSTNFLLWRDSSLASQIKDRLHRKIKKDFKIDVPDEATELSNELESRKIIVTAVSQIRKKVGQTSLLFQHNVEYGFIRNLVGGSLLALLFSLSIVSVATYQHNNSLRLTGTILFIIYLVPVAVSKLLMKRYGKDYAKVLLEEYLKSN